jgi:PAS domain S-box-containing protein
MELIAVFACGVLLAAAAGAPAVAMKMHLARRLRQEHADYQSQLQRIESESPDATFSIDESGTVLSFNQAAESLFGYAAAEAVGNHISMLLPAASGASGSSYGLNTIHRAPRTRNGIGLEVTGRRKNGATVPLDLALHESTRRGRRVFRAVARDLSDRVAAEAHAGRLHLLEGLVACVGAPVVVLDSEGRIVKCNPAFSACVERGEHEAEGRYYWELVLDAVDWASARAAVAEVISSGKSEKGQILWRTPSGTAMPMVTVMTALRAGNAPAAHAAIVAFRADEVAWEENAGSTTMEAIEQLAGGIAQQFNDLLTSINGYSELVLSSLPASAPVREDVEEIRRAGERAAALTHQLLVFSRKQPMVARIVDVSETISGMKPMLRMLLDERIQISTVLDLAGTTVETDPGWLEQVILNLAVNARDAMPAGGKLTIETAIEDLDAPTARRVAKLPPGKYVVLTVTDTGCGMEPATRARAFEPFYTTKHSKGMGLGLSAVYGVVKQSGGNAVLQSIPGSGTSVRIYLPYREAVQEQQPRGLFLVRSAGA